MKRRGFLGTLLAALGVAKAPAPEPKRMYFAGDPSHFRPRRLDEIRDQWVTRQGLPPGYSVYKRGEYGLRVAQEEFVRLVDGGTEAGPIHGVSRS